MTSQVPMQTQQSMPQPIQQQPQQQQQSQVDHVSPTNSSGMHSSASPEAANGTTYYPNQGMNEAQNYALGYNEANGGRQQMTPATSSFQEAQMYYTAGGQVPNGPVQNNAGQVISFGAHPAVPMPSADFLWNGRGTTWQDWATAIADTNERFNANQLMLGGNAQSRPGMDASMMAADPTTMAQAQPEMTATHMQQWPMVMFGPGGTNGA